MSRTIWIVTGSTGEYSDRQEWVVEAHVSQEAAISRVSQLDALMLELGATGRVSGYTAQKPIFEAMRTHINGDPNFSLDYTGTSYYYAECELKEPS